MPRRAKKEARLEKEKEDNCVNFTKPYRVGCGFLLIFNNLFLFSQNVKFKNNFYSILSDSTVSLYSYNVGKSDRFDEILFLDSIVICKKRKYNVVKIEESAFKSKSPRKDSLSTTKELQQKYNSKPYQNYLEETFNNTLFTIVVNGKTYTIPKS